MHKISRILIANRGVIALRVIKACKELGIETVLVVSEADRDTLPAKLADKTVCIGPAPSQWSYLRKDIVVQTAISQGCDAVHPGYGFLAENPDFARMCEDNGIIFIGPNSESLERFGNKLEAKRIAQECGVPTIPGSEEIRDLEGAKRAIENIGFPALLKGAFCGGGKSIKIVRNADELKRMFESASAEARAAFGESTLYIERYFPNARHIEVQLLADEHGNVIHLGERDCSVQRRYQKIVEEALAYTITDEIREKLYESAITLAKKVGYRNAGTVEFIFDQDEERFYFLEVNARVQV